MANKLNHSQLSDSDFIEHFLNGTMNPKLFNHEAHLRLTWLYINKVGLNQAEQDIQNQLQSFVEIVGAKDKYHKTLTIVAVRIVNHFMQKSKSNNFDEFILEFPKLKHEFKALVNMHYSFDVFISKNARIEFIKPDLIPFD